MAIVGKDASFRLVDYIENLYLENLILKDELRHRNQAQMAAMLEKLKADPRITTRVRALFAPLRARILEEAFEEQADPRISKSKSTEERSLDLFASDSLPGRAFYQPFSTQFCVQKVLSRAAN
jgi:hypothetical protein